MFMTAMKVGSVHDCHDVFFRSLKIRRSRYTVYARALAKKKKKNTNNAVELFFNL